MRSSCKVGPCFGWFVDPSGKDVGFNTGSGLIETPMRRLTSGVGEFINRSKTEANEDDDE